MRAQRDTEARLPNIAINNLTAAVFVNKNVPAQINGSVTEVVRSDKDGIILTHQREVHIAFIINNLEIFAKSGWISWNQC